MRNLPVTTDLLPHIRKARLHRGASTSIAKLKSVKTRVQICVAIAAIDLNRVVRDRTIGVLFDKVDEVCLGAGGIFDVLGRDGGQEGQIAMFCKRC